MPAPDVNEEAELASEEAAWESKLASIKAPGNDRFVGSSIDNTNDEEEGEAEEDDDMDDSGSQGFEQEEDEVEY